MIKVNREVFNTFLNLISLKGDVEIKECIMTGSKTELTVLAQTISKVLLLKSKIDGDFSELGEIGIDDLSLLKKIVSKFEDAEIIINKNNNKLEITNNKDLKVSLVLRSPQYILTTLDNTKFEGYLKKAQGNEFTLKQDDIAKLQSYYEAFGKEIAISADANTLVFNLSSSENEADIKITVAENMEKFTVKMKSLFLDVLSSIKEDVKISYKDGFPCMVVKSENTSYKIEYLIAPTK